MLDVWSVTQKCRLGFDQQGSGGRLLPSTTLPSLLLCNFDMNRACFSVNVFFMRQIVFFFFLLITTVSVQWAVAMCFLGVLWVFLKLSAGRSHIWMRLLMPFPWRLSLMPRRQRCEATTCFCTQHKSHSKELSHTQLIPRSQQGVDLHRQTKEALLRPRTRCTDNRRAHDKCNRGGEWRRYRCVLSWDKESRERSQLIGGFDVWGHSAIAG